MTCPTCNKPAVYDGNPARPFCSERCKMIDLGKWAGGVFRIPTQESPSEEFPEDDRSHEEN